MFKFGAWLALALVLACAPAVAAEPGEPEAEDLQAVARQFIELLAAGEFEKATERFDDTMKEALPPDKLAQVWRTINTQAGAFQNQGATRTEEQAGYQVVFVRCHFEKMDLDAKVVFDAKKRIAGLFFVPPQEVPEIEPQYRLPSYARPDAFEEIELTIGEGEWAVPGTLLVPRGEGPFAALLLVHGSGPLDRDETIGPNKPFLDLASGLASNGIAVLRYEKRTKAHAGKMARIQESITLEDETIADAVAAVRLLRRTDAIDADRVFVLGHSLGGVAAPRIAGQVPEAAGLILLATPSRPLVDLLVEQFSYIFSVDGTVTDEEQQEIDRLARQVASIKASDPPAESDSDELLLGAGRAYWSDLRGHPAPEAIAKLPQPVLILQGGRDYQVPVGELDGWKKALAGRDGVTFKLYPKLNHLFIAGEGRSTPSEYESPGHVDSAVIDDIAAWIQGRPSSGHNRPRSNPS